MKSPRDEVTPAATYFNRRAFLQGGLLATSAVVTGAVYRSLNGMSTDSAATKELSGVVTAEGAGADGFRVAGEALTPLASIAHYNNFYEFTTNKDGVAERARGFVTDGWKVVVDGLCHEPRVFDLDDLRKVAPTEERVYRMRCVEAWSMVIPWAGLPLAKLLERVRPMADARYVAFETLLDPARMPGQKTSALAWPYVEGLRLDEAMHPLTLLATGLYGHELPPQDGAPVRLVVP